MIPAWPSSLPRILPLHDLAAVRSSAGRSGLIAVEAVSVSQDLLLWALGVASGSHDVASLIYYLPISSGIYRIVKPLCLKGGNIPQKHCGDSFYFINIETSGRPALRYSGKLDILYTGVLLADETSDHFFQLGPPVSTFFVISVHLVFPCGGSSLFGPARWPPFPVL